jgi:signal peptidase I
MHPVVRRLLFAAVLAVVGTAALAAAAMGTGRIAYVVTDGVSMKPTLHAGDLVLIARAESYRVGDIVAYRGGDGRLLVLHRIIGGDPTGFVVKGDSNQSIDSLRPAAHDVIGRTVLHIPKIGAATRSPIARGLLVGAALIMLGALVMSLHRSAPATANGARRSRRVRGLVALDVLVLMAALAAFAFPSRPAPPPRPTGSSQTGTFTYAAAVPVSDVYPTGAIVTGDPLFVNLVTSLAVSFRYGTDAPSSSVRGTARLDVQVSAPSGWHTTLPLVPETALADGVLDMTGTVDIARILEMAARVATATSVGAGTTLDVAIAASTSVSVHGANPVAFTSKLPFRLTPFAMILSGAEPTMSSQGPAVASTVVLAPAPPAPVRRSGATRDLIKFVMLAVLLLCGAVTLVLWPDSSGVGRDMSVGQY